MPISSEVAVTYVGATREQYATALDGLWGDLTGALTRLERCGVVLPGGPRVRHGHVQ